jgi:tRNA pseudouridine55 synthase
MRHRRGADIHGWLVVDKPPGTTSVSVVSAVRRAANAAKAGHGGTLDPLASGVLPVALGEATKTVAYVMDRTKSYRFTVRWGERRDTDDVEGSIVECSDHRPRAGEITALLPRFEGEIEQVPPIYSAVKIEGRRAYALARAAVPVELFPRRVRIVRFRLIGIPDSDHAEFEVESGKGAYMRSLARDLARALGTCGYITALRRTAVGPFTEVNAIPLDKVSSLGHSGALLEHVLPVEAALADIPALTLTEAEARRLQQGQPIAVLPVARRSPQQHVFKDAVICAMAEGRPVALARIRGGEIRPVRVLNL